MPLSEEELRLLEQMERALTEEDPKFASTLRGSSFRRAARQRALLSGLGFVGGVALMMTGAVANMIPVAILGFVIMLVTATYSLSALRARPVQPVNDQSSLHDRMDRWRHRHED